MLDGVRVIRVPGAISRLRKRPVPRLLHYGSYSATAFYGGLFAGKPDVLVSFSPPLPLGLSAWLLSRLWRVPWVLQIEDLYPDAAVAAGVMVNKKAIDFFSAMEQFLYQHADRISIISESFRRTLLGKGVPDSKLEVIPVWADPNEVLPLPKQNLFRHKHHLDGKFVVMYAGNIWVDFLSRGCVGCRRTTERSIRYSVCDRRRRCQEGNARVRSTDRGC